MSVEASPSLTSSVELGQLNQLLINAKINESQLLNAVNFQALAGRATSNNSSISSASDAAHSPVLLERLDMLRSWQQQQHQLLIQHQRQQLQMVEAEQERVRKLLQQKAPVSEGLTQSSTTTASTTKMDERLEKEEFERLAVQLGRPVPRLLDPPRTPPGYRDYGDPALDSDSCCGASLYDEGVYPLEPVTSPHAPHLKGIAKRITFSDGSQEGSSHGNPSPFCPSALSDDGVDGASLFGDEEKCGAYSAGTATTDDGRSWSMVASLGGNMESSLSCQNLASFSAQSKFTATSRVTNQGDVTTAGGVGRSMTNGVPMFQAGTGLCTVNAADIYTATVPLMMNCNKQPLTQLTSSDAFMAGTSLSANHNEALSNGLSGGMAGPPPYQQIPGLIFPSCSVVYSGNVIPAGDLDAAVAALASFKCEPLRTTGISSSGQYPPQLFTMAQGSGSQALIRPATTMDSNRSTNEMNRSGFAVSSQSNNQNGALTSCGSNVEPTISFNPRLPNGGSQPQPAMPRTVPSSATVQPSMKNQIALSNPITMIRATLPPTKSNAVVNSVQSTMSMWNHPTATTQAPVSHGQLNAAQIARMMQELSGQATQRQVLRHGHEELVALQEEELDTTLRDSETDCSENSEASSVIYEGVDESREYYSQDEAAIDSPEKRASYQNDSGSPRQQWDGEDQHDLDKSFDEMPVAGLGSKKTFEELVEEELHRMEQPLSQSPVQPRKRQFLRKGQGLARFQGPRKENAVETKKKKVPTATLR